MSESSLSEMFLYLWAGKKLTKVGITESIILWDDHVSDALVEIEAGLLFAM